MKSNQTKQIFLTAAILFCGFAGIYFLSNYLEKNRPVLPEGYADEDLALQGARLKGYAFGFEGLIADWYWIKSLQYVGDKILKNRDPNLSLDNLRRLNPRLLYPYLDNATTLDPKFLAPYSYGAVVLPAIDNEQAIKLLQKGIADNPNEWKLYQHLGYIYWRLGDYEKASEMYGTGAKLPNAPKFMLMMTAKTKSEGGSLETARAIYRQMYDEAEDAQVRETAELRLLETDSLEERAAIQKVLQEFQAKNSRCANGWREILPLLQAIKLPDNKNFRVDKSNNLIDPTDAPYILDRENCRVKLDFAKTKIPLN